MLKKFKFHSLLFYYPTNLINVIYIYVGSYNKIYIWILYRFYKNSLIIFINKIFHTRDLHIYLSISNAYLRNGYDEKIYI